MIQLKYFIPLVIFIILSFFLWRGLANDPSLIPSVLINKPMPQFDLSSLEDPSKRINEAMIKGEVTLLNVWATWCVACAIEHPLLVKIKQANQVKIIGLNYRDQRELALKWIQQAGNPYTLNLFDGDGRAAIEWGIYGTPETFLLDKRGIIRYRHVGALDETIWQQHFLPKINELKAAL